MNTKIFYCLKVSYKLLIKHCNCQNCYNGSIIPKNYKTQSIISTKWLISYYSGWCDCKESMKKLQQPNLGKAIK